MPMEIYVSMMCLEPIVYLEMETYTSLTTENTKYLFLKLMHRGLDMATFFLSLFRISCVSKLFQTYLRYEFGGQ